MMRQVSAHQMDSLWKEYFMNPWLWQHNRLNIKNDLESPDFAHKLPSPCPWIHGRCNPAWVEEELSRRKTAKASASCSDLNPCHDDDDSEDPTIVSRLQVCGRNRDLCQGMRIHDEILGKGFLEKRNPYIDSALISMYAKCGMLGTARMLHDELHLRSIVSWNALISGHAMHGRGSEALSCFEQMQHEGFPPNSVTFVCALGACGSVGSIEKGEEIHEKIASSGLVLRRNAVLCTALVGMYAKCGALEKAEELHKELRIRDVVSWNVLIGGYAEHERGQEALECFERMRSEVLCPNEATFACALKGCCLTGAIETGREIHDEIVCKGLLDRNLVLGNALLDMYAKCDDALVDAKQVHAKLCARDVVSWSSLIAGYVQQGQSKEALECFAEMRIDGVSPNEIAFVCGLRACGSVGAIGRGVEIHHEISRRGFLERSDELGDALVDMYARCGALAKAREVLEQHRARSTVSWSSLIAGYVQHRRGQEALDCFESMKKEGFSPDVVTFMSILKACAGTGAIDKGRQIHDEIVAASLLNDDAPLGTALVDMYAQCGMFSRAKRILSELPSRNAAAWNALTAAYARRGRSDEAFECFERMQREGGLLPDAVTFLCLMNACSHRGLLEKAEMHFHEMRDKHGVVPSVEHFTCMVAMLGFGGRFGKAVSAIKMMPFSGSRPVWLALLAACRKWGNVKLGRWAFDQIMHLDNTCASAYVLMISIYADAAMHEAVDEVEAMRRRCGAPATAETS